MGPDFWTLEFWKSLATNMAKMKLNFVGFHTYLLFSQGIAEPAVWVGTKSGFNATSGAVHPSAAYETTWYSTEDCFKGTPWPGNTTQIRATVPGQSSVPTSAFCCGAAALFERSCYGSPAQAATCFPRSEVEAATVLNSAMELFRDAFAWSADFAGVDGCVGVEFPLVMPTKLVAANTSLLDVYTGMFGRIVASKLRLKVFWLWTNEGVQIRGGPQNGKGKPQADPMWQQQPLANDCHSARIPSPSLLKHLPKGEGGAAE